MGGGFNEVVAFDRPRLRGAAGGDKLNLESPLLAFCGGVRGRFCAGLDLSATSTGVIFRFDILIE